MPDHTNHTNAMGPRSPAGSDSPLSLVIGRRHNSRDHHLIHNKTPPPPTFDHRLHLANNGSSSGFSEGDSPNESPVRTDHPRDETEASEEQPLSLVVPKKTYDSGHDEEDEEEPTEDSLTKENNNGLKIKDFAKFSLGEDAREKIPAHSDQALLAALTAPLKHKPTTAANVETVQLNEMDAMSEVSSMSSMSDMIHAQRIGDHTVYPCDFCDKVFGNKYHLASHLVTHTGERSFECKYCTKTFGRRSTLRAHMTTHTKTSNFMCPMCEKACNDNNSLEEHIRMHTGEKPFVCTICTKAYARKSHLNVHYRVHTGERPFVCMACGKDFTEKRFLNDHMQTAHSGNDGPLKCPNCYREFAYKTSLKQHLKKQMCAKNLNRGQAAVNGGQGAHAKQFACPFCEKSYSWKQTLKQHVSMYHRNKVHTDEFWKYELAKHRRTVMDSKTNEDMWKKQLGKHADEFPPEKDQDMDKWLEQIKKNTASDVNQNSQVSAEMKFLALQSLQSMMSMNSDSPSTPPHCGSPPKPESQQGGGYLNLLAHLSAQRKAEVDISRLRKSSESSSATTASLGGSAFLPEMKEECAAKRTQMWLAQLGRYRQNSVQDDLDKNHDELWEEQIAKVKSKPVKSPLEPIEITINDDQAEEVKQRMECAELPPPPPPPASFQKPCRMVPLMSALQCHPRRSSEAKSSRSPSPNPNLAVKRPPTPASPIRNVISIKTSAIQRVENQPRTFSLNLEVNNNNDSGFLQQRPHIPVPLLPTARHQGLVVQKKRLLEIPDEDFEVPPPQEEIEDTTLDLKAKDPVTAVAAAGEQDSSSVLKSLLMDRIPRKRPLTPPKTSEGGSSPKRPSICSDSSDILRRRLMGLNNNLPEAEQHVLKPKFQPPSATITSQQLQQNEGQSPVDLRKEDDKQQQQQPPKSYTQTSVLKHLLYRYTNAASEDN